MNESSIEITDQVFNYLLMGVVNNSDIRKIFIAKNKDGNIGTFNMWFDNSCCCFMEKEGT